ncbi:sporulation integral membrane protein YtvI [Breznakia sp. PF5-3]|uniref:sporulation integral membrane protein YtvI n=1 Tax=unclassified Breznakia TaxID=2623764 RepID=UPI002406EFCC|nr:MULTISPECIES: sporulation integral membrane protein YtvI [unclassified Breznakia]MDL2276229.1 sporulation integral membrane protein YtvI [Breznakia sp. OttesenSCG-928-G09]MDF9824887.1 sporulation integral membrane protein YtvI [Breznakia sp. PM6-1]MDF9835614.1 sporulation integral membrane protein YtvI [Breznakia sp. PF5-3]MDF9837970.1 sporulation integral membrane protein YtvI [Breznakia sp. PFB2-8]MDF9859959.1 sporulation integral membrane protein YtvI [Breznakia sp. PH5-24]
MEMEKRKKFLVNLCYYIAIIGIVVFVFRYVVGWCLPFILGFGIAFIMQGLIKKISKRIKIKNKFVSLLVLTLFYIIVGGLVTLGVMQLLAMLGSFFKDLPAYYSSTIKPALETLFSGLEDVLNNISPNLAQGLNDVNTVLLDIAKSVAPSVSSKSLSYLTSFASFVPSFLISFLLMIISSYFFTIDFQKITNFIMLQFNDKTKNIIRHTRRHMVQTIGKFIKSYGIIMFITFVELSIGLFILQIDNAIAIAFLIAVFDILPVLGTGGIMIPWIIITILNGQLELAIGLAIVYIIITVIRNIIEPKIVGVQVGAHPIIMLISMFVGTKLLGIFGIFILPILVILVKNLNEEGIIHLYKNPNDKK